MIFFVPDAGVRTWCLLAHLLAVPTGNEASLRFPGTYNSFMKSNTQIEKIVIEVVTNELSNCVLAVVWDDTFSGSYLLYYLTKIPTPKQVLKVDVSRMMSSLLWRAGQCRGYVLLLNDPSPLMDLVEKGHHKEWDYSGKFVLAGLSMEQLYIFIRTRKGRKTEHIVGIVKDNDEEYFVVNNMLYHEKPIVRVFNWQTGRRHVRQDGRDVAYSLSYHNLEPTASSNLFLDKTKNLHGAVLNVVTFLFPPAVMYWKQQGSSGKQWFGDNIRLMEAIAHVFNFTFRFKEPPPGEVWGELTANGSWNGMVGMLGRGEGDIGLANLFITALRGREEFQGYTAPYGQEKTCFLVKRNAPLPRWHSLALPFTFHTWIVVVVLMVFAGPLFFFLAHPALPRDNLTKETFNFKFFYTFAMHFREAQILVPTRPSLQVFVVFLWLYVIIITVAYSANLTAFLTVERIPLGITSLKQLFESSLVVYGIGPFFRNNMAEAKNIFVKGLTQRFQQKKSFEDVYQHIEKGKGVYIGSFSHLSYTRSITTTPKGKPILRIMQECFQPFSVAIGLQSHSPLKKNFDKVVNWVVEAGLVQYWFEETLIIAKKIRKETYMDHEGYSKTDHTRLLGPSERSQAMPLTAEHLQSMFIVFLIGNLIAIILFIVEIILEKCTR